MTLKDTSFVDLMLRRICNVLLLANPYDAFMLEDDGRVDEKIFSEYARLGLRFPPRFIQVANQEEAEHDHRIRQHRDRMLTEAVMAVIPADNEIRLEGRELFLGRLDEHVLYEVSLPCHFHDEADRHAGIRRQ